MQWPFSYLLQYNKNLRPELTTSCTLKCFQMMTCLNAFVESPNVHWRPWRELLKNQRTFVVMLVLAMKLYLYKAGDQYDVVNTRMCYDSTLLSWNSMAIECMHKAMCTRLSFPSPAEKEPGYMCKATNNLNNDQ